VEFFNIASLQDWVIRYGYWALFIGTFLEGETILIVAGYLAQSGYLDLSGVILAAFLGSFCGDQTFFFIGRWQGMALLDKRPAWRQKAGRAFALLARYQIAVILGFRFVYGIRNITPFVIGTSGLKPWRFFVLNGMGACVWALVFGGLGYTLGGLADEALEPLGYYEKGSLTLLALLLIGCLVALRRQKKSAN
jgi:membrane protein DedA with SNARE-associated domain